MSDGHVPNRHPDDAPLATVPTTRPPQYSPYTPLRRAPSSNFHPTSYNMNSSPPPPMTDQENIPPMATPPGTNDRKRKPDGYQFDTSPKRPRQDISSGSPRTPLATQSQSRSSASRQHGTQHNYGAFPATPESTPEQIRKTPQTAEPAPFTSMQHLRDAGLYVQEPDPSKPNSKYYAVAFGKFPGIYRKFQDAFQQKGNDIYKYLRGDFFTAEEALAFMNANRSAIEEAERLRDQRKQERIKEATALYERDVARLAPRPTPNILADYYVPGTNIKLEPEQKAVVQKILEGENVFYTGPAGTGKSAILKTIVPMLREQGWKVQIIAPSNLAAYNVGGQTIHNFAAWNIYSSGKKLDDLKKAARGKKQWKKLNDVDVLVIDEISMVPNSDLERLSEIMKASRSPRHNADLPFGGVQVVVTGDFCQLAPVEPFKHCMGCGTKLKCKDEKDPLECEISCETKGCGYGPWRMADKWAFCSEVWQNCNFTHINLTKIHRQSDRKFVAILQKIRRDGNILAPHGQLLLHHPNETKDAVQLHSTRKKVKEVNDKAIEDIVERTKLEYNCLDHFQQNDRSDESLVDYKELSSKHPANLHCLKRLDGCRYDPCVLIKGSMRVMLVANIDPAKGLVNGCQGSVTGFESFDRSKLPCKEGRHGSYVQSQLDLFAKQNTPKPWPIVTFDNKEVRTIYPDCAVTEVITYKEGGKVKITNRLSRTQLPLLAGYAITVHKSQGMTLDRVTVNLSKAFEASQIYVALSRARSLNGLNVVALPENTTLRADPTVREFFDTYLDPTSPRYIGQRPHASQAAPQDLEMVQSSSMPSSSQLLQSSPTPQAPQTSESSTSLIALQDYLALVTPPLSQEPESEQAPPSSQSSESSQEWL